MGRLIALFVALFVVAASAQTPTDITKVGGLPVSQVIVTPVLVATLSNSAQTVQATGPKKLDWIDCANTNATLAYVQVFDVAGSVTVGTTAPKISIPMYPSPAPNRLAAMGLTFSNAIKVAATTTSTGSTAPGTALVCNFGWW